MQNNFFDISDQQCRDLQFCYQTLFQSQENFNDLLLDHPSAKMLGSPPILLKSLRQLLSFV